MGYRALLRPTRLTARAARMRLSFRECGVVCHITPDECDKAVQEKFLSFHIGKSLFVTTHHCRGFAAKLFSEPL